MLQQVLPPGYFGMSDEETYPRILAAKQRLGSRLMILGHHYQRDEVIQFADQTGDSFGLSRDAAANRDANYIVFCGVHFMAESADILTRDEQVVILPDLEAGCSMADMADLDQVEDAWDEICEVYAGGASSGRASSGRAGSGDDTVMPITYINSAANLKAFVGEHGGAVCTSSNAAPIIRWALTQRERLLFFPDQHLGRNTAVKMGIPLDQMIVWDPRRPPGEYGGNKREDVERAKIILWRGHCQVHQRFLPEHVESFREKFPGINIIVHPECSYEVVQMADHVGSTASILKTINQAPAGTSWAVGTEIHLVDRIRRANPDKFVSSLVPGVCLCSTMNRIDPQHLLWVLENLEKDRIVNQIRVPEPVASRAKEALDRMLTLS